MVVPSFCSGKESGLGEHFCEGRVPGGSAKRSVQEVPCSFSLFFPPGNTVLASGQVFIRG